jgi:hypothetical protein
MVVPEVTANTMAPHALAKQQNQNKKHYRAMAIYFVCIDTKGGILLRDFCCPIVSFVACTIKVL